jgi:hypothetical protein
MDDCSDNFRVFYYDSRFEKCFDSCMGFTIMRNVVGQFIRFFMRIYYFPLFVNIKFRQECISLWLISFTFKKFDRFKLAAKVAFT